VTRQLGGEPRRFVGKTAGAQFVVLLQRRAGVGNESFDTIVIGGILGAESVPLDFSEVGFHPVYAPLDFTMSVG
jgi:hypothetical protein